MPVNEDNQGTNLFYSVNLGPVHFITMNSVYFGYGKAGDELITQYNWLVKDLQQAQSRRAEIPWIVVMAHLNMYCTPNWTDPNVYHDYNECLEDAENFKSYSEELFYENKVDFVIQGHVHNYERDTAIYRNESISNVNDTFYSYVTPQAPVYIVSGNAGNDHGHNDPISDTFQPWTRYMTEEYGVGELYVYNGTHAYWQQYRSSNQTVLDYVYVTKDPVS